MVRYTWRHFPDTCIFENGYECVLNWVGRQMWRGSITDFWLFSLFLHFFTINKIYFKSRITNETTFFFPQREMKMVSFTLCYYLIIKKKERYLLFQVSYSALLYMHCYSYPSITNKKNHAFFINDFKWFLIILIFIILF